MEFAYPERLWWLVLAAILAAMVVRGRTRRAREWAALGRSDRPPGDGAWGWVAATALAIVAGAQPRWGRVERPGVATGHDVVLLVDVSRSMAAEDAVPSRLGAAIEAAEGLLAALAADPGERAGVVAFSGRGVAVCPVTENLGAATDALLRLRPGMIQPGGTDLAAALSAALGAFEPEGPSEGRTVILFSDGEDLAGAGRAAIPRLRDQKVVVHAVAVGDPDQGHPIPLDGARELTYRGRPVRTRRDDETLEALSRATGGAFLPLGLRSADLGSLYRERIAPAERRQRRWTAPPERAERFGLFLLGALLVGLSGARRPRIRWGMLGLSVALVGAGPDAATPAGAVAAGRSAYARGDFGAALAAFNRAVALAPESAVPRYDAASALFQLGRFDEAEARYREARAKADPALRTKIDFALGNTAAARGDDAAALRHYADCLASRARGPGLDQVRADAEANRRFVAGRKPPPPTDPPGDRTSGRREAPEAAKKKEAAPSPSAQPSDPAPSAGPGRVGGAGGSGRDSPGAESPDARVEAAIAAVRAARRRQDADLPPPDREIQDW